jgi:hypothetical protein
MVFRRTIAEHSRPPPARIRRTRFEIAPFVIVVSLPMISSLPMPFILRIVTAMAFSECVGELSPPPAMANPAQDVLRLRNVPYRVRLCPRFIPVISNPKTVHRSACLANASELLTVIHGGAAAVVSPPGGLRPLTPPPI